MSRNLLSLDVFLVLALLAGFGWSTFSPSLWAALVVLAVGGYLSAHIFLPVQTADRIKLGLVWFLIAAVAIEPAMGMIILRHSTAPYLFAHDSVIQTEEAIKFLLAGKNPYLENYLSTPMAQWVYDVSGVSVNPGLYHLAYWPFLILFSLPFYLVSQTTIGWFDERMLYVPMFVLTLMLLSHLVRTREKRLALLLFVELHPLFLPFFIQGRNDVFVLFWLVLSFVLIQRQQRVAAFIVLAFACATKPTAWFILPFFAIHLFRHERFSLARLAVPFGAFVAVMTAIVLPFFLWNPSAFVDDVWHYTAGTTAFSYPINSFGFGAIGLELGWIPDKMAVFPFALLQLVFGLPALFLLCRYQLAHNTNGRLWLCYGFFTLVISFFSRVFNDNHLGFIISLFAIGLLVEEETIDVV